MLFIKKSDYGKSIALIEILNQWNGPRVYVPMKKYSNDV